MKARTEMPKKKNQKNNSLGPTKIKAELLRKGETKLQYTMYKLFNRIGKMKYLMSGQKQIHVAYTNYHLKNLGG